MIPVFDLKTTVIEAIKSLAIRYFTKTDLYNYLKTFDESQPQVSSFGIEN